MNSSLSAVPARDCERPGALPGLESIEDTGLAPSVVEQILVKTLYARGELSAKQLSAALGLKFSLISWCIQNLKLHNIVQVKRSLGMGEISAILGLTDAGQQKAREYLEINHYVGPAPVPLAQYEAVVRRQRRPPGWLTREKLVHAYRKMVLSPRVLDQIGPAVNSGRSFLIYGKPGNGKTYLAEALADLDEDAVYIPHAIESQGQIVQVFDPVLHVPLAAEDAGDAVAADECADGRWLRCRRPFITSGGELAPAMLDLSYNPAARVYEAPLQLKANNGIYLIDDFGRQKATPAEILNRWIVPMERKVDYLSFQSGGKMTVPFETFLVFSTNLNPEDLGDEAFLRRIQYKMLVHNPDEAEFREIFHRVAEANGLRYAPETLDRFVARHYREAGRAFRRCHPRDVLSHALDLVNFEKGGPELTPELLDRVFHSCFVQEDAPDGC